MQFACVRVCARVCACVRGQQAADRSVGEKDPAGEGDAVNRGGGAGWDQDDEERNSQDGGEVGQHIYTTY